MTTNIEIPFEALGTADLIVDAIYKGGSNPQGGYANDPLHVLFPKCQINGGFRKIKRRNSGKPAYVVLYTSMDKLEWPD